MIIELTGEHTSGQRRSGALSASRSPVCRKLQEIRNTRVLLNAAEIRQTLEQVQAAFPRFGEWEYVNEIDDNHGGFAVWGEFVFEPNEPSASTFFITLDTYGES